MFEDILANEKAYRFLMNALAVGEIDSSRGIDKLANLLPDPGLREETLRLHADEVRHGKLFAQRLKELGFDPAPLDKHLDYEAFLHDMDFGIHNDRLEKNTLLDDDEVIKFLVACRVREERACAELSGMMECFRPDARTHVILSEILKDEHRHVGYATAALERYAKKGYGKPIRETLARYRRLEAAAHARVSINFTREFFRILDYPRWILAAAFVVIRGQAAWRRLFPY